MADTWLHIGAETTELAQEEAVALRIGSASIAREHFRHDPPTPLELESAIAAVEDEIARVHAALAGGSGLYTRDGLLRDIALEIGVPPATEMQLALDAVEHAFARLPLRALGKEKAGVLVILRELMHHLGFRTIVVRAT
jgi:exopolyphosphatase/pppGpp-phosphohydrolase